MIIFADLMQREKLTAISYCLDLVFSMIFEQEGTYSGQRQMYCAACNMLMQSIFLTHFIEHNQS